MASLHELSAAALSRLYGAREASPVEALDAVLAHIARWEPHLCALWAFDPEAARAALAEGERLLPDYSIAAMRVGHPFRHDAPRERYVQALKSLGWKG